MKMQNGTLALAVAVALNAEGNAPEWVELIPPGVEIAGRDGRAWINDQPLLVIDTFNRMGRDMPIDWEHATEKKAPNGEPAPAAGWINKVEVRDGGAIWGRVAWNERGKQSVESREYRYLSPVFAFEKESRRIVRILSAGLTNSPNLHLTALNHEQDEDDPMKLSEAIRKALGLKDDATEEQAVNAIEQLRADLDTAQNREATPSLDKFVPRSDYDKAIERATNAENQVKSNQEKALNTEIDSEIDAALKAGKIAPASVEYHKANCREEGGLDRFREFVKSAPAIAGDTDLGNKKPGDQGKALNAEEQKIAEMFGNTAEDIQKYGRDAA